MPDSTQSMPGPLDAAGRTFIILVDTLGTDASEMFRDGSEGYFLLKLGSMLAGASGGRLLLASIVTVPEGESVSAYSITAKTRRQELEGCALRALGDNAPVVISGQGGQSSMPDHGTVAPVVRVAAENEAWKETRNLLEAEPRGLLLLPMRPTGLRDAWLRRALRNPLPCDVAWVRPPLRKSEDRAEPTPFRNGMSILMPARGGPQASLALELCQDLMEAVHAEVTMLHVLQDMPERERASEEAPFAELVSRMSHAQKGNITPHRTLDVGHDPAGTISQAASNYDMLIMGAGGDVASDVGRLTELVAGSTQAAMIAVKTRIPIGPAIRAARKRARPHVLDPETLSLIVDKWFAENTFHQEEFADLGRLVDIKRKSGTTISLGLPALNEEETIGGVISVLRRSLMEEVPLVDEIVVIDSDSEDRTREIAAEMGVPVYIHQQILPEAGPPYTGKGEALWKSLHVLKGDIIAWVDTDVSNMDPGFVYGLVGPLLREPRIGYVKGYYHRPIQLGGDLQHEGGGRVTELTVRPLMNLFFPLLSGLVQPLAGEYAGRREVLEQLPFFSGYGVETGMLIDLLERFGLSSIGQVNLERRVHRNRSLADLSLTAFAIVQVILTRLQERSSIKLLEELNNSMKLIRFEEDHLSLVVRRVRDFERPPIATIPAYREKHPAK